MKRLPPPSPISRNQPQLWTRHAILKEISLFVFNWYWHLLTWLFEIYILALNILYTYVIKIWYFKSNCIALQSDRILLNVSELPLITPPRNRGVVIFSLQFVCVCEPVCLSVCLCVSVSERNSSRTGALIWMRFMLHDWLLLWLGPYWNWWPFVKGQGHSNLKHACKQSVDRTAQPIMTQISQ